MSFFTGKEISGTPLETRPGTELLGRVFEDVLRTGDFGRLGAQGFGFAAFPGGGQSASIGPSFGAMGTGGGLLGEERRARRRGEGEDGFGEAVGEAGDMLDRTRRGLRESDEENPFRRAIEGAIAGVSGQNRGMQDPSEILRAGIAIGSQLPEFQFGGRLRPGQTGIVGDAGPELATATRAGTQVIPLLSPTGRPGRTSPGAQNIATQTSIAPFDPTQVLPGGGGTFIGGTSPIDDVQGPRISPPEGSPLGPGGGSIPSGTQPGGGIPSSDPNRGPAGIPGGPGGIRLPGPAQQFSPFEQAALDLVGGGSPITPEIAELISGATRERGISPEVQNILSGLMGAPAVPQGAQDLIGQVQGAGGLPPEVQQILGNIQGAQTLSPEVQQILGNIQGAETLSPEALQILQNVQGLAGGGTQEAVAGAQALNRQLFEALRPFEERQLEQQAAQIREGFSGIGNRLSTNLLGAETQLRGELTGQFQRGRAENLQNALNTLLQNQQAGAATQASLFAPLVGAQQQQLATQAGLVNPLLQAGQQQLATQAGLVNPLLGAQQAQQGNLVDLANLLTGAAGQQQATQAGLVPSLLGAGQQQAGIQSELARALLGTGEQRAGTIADFIPRLMGAQTQAQLASLAPLELIAQFFRPGSPNFQQGILGEMLGAGAQVAGAFA